MSKKWYTVTFSAKMSEDDVRAMKNCFYDAMEEAMQISPCANLDIKLENDQDEGEYPDLFLEREELLECDIKTGNIKVDKQIFDGFVANTYINIQFVEDKDNGIYQFSMVAEDDKGIFMEYLDYINE